MDEESTTVQKIKYIKNHYLKFDSWHRSPKCKPPKDSDLPHRNLRYAIRGVCCDDFHSQLLIHLIKFPYTLTFRVEPEKKSRKIPPINHFPKKNSGKRFMFCRPFVRTCRVVGMPFESSHFDSLTSFWRKIEHRGISKASERANHPEGRIMLYDKPLIVVTPKRAGIGTFEVYNCWINLFVVRYM